MDSHQLITKYKLIDVITVGDATYCLSSQPQSVPGCIVVSVQQLPTYLSLFLRQGYSERFRRPYSETLGLSSWTFYSYSLEQLPIGRKQAFSHALAGTGGRHGLLAKWNGRKIGKSAFMAPLEQQDEIATFFSRWQVQYTAEVVLRG